MAAHYVFTNNTFCLRLFVCVINMFKLQDRPENICVFYSVIGRISVFRLVFFLFSYVWKLQAEKMVVYMFFYNLQTGWTEIFKMYNII